MIPLTPFGTGFLAVALALLLVVPRRYALFPLLVGTCYMTLAQGVQIGPLNFFCIRILIAAGVVRAILRREYVGASFNGLDRLMVVWSAWALCSSIFHRDPGEALIGALGLVYNSCGIYFLVRIYCKTPDEVTGVFRFICVLLIPLALEMIAEHLTNYNSFSALGGVFSEPQIREGRLRAQGPFAHAILAGTVGAVCLPFALALWRNFRLMATLGAASCFTMVVASASSGPAMSAIFAVVALALWPIRHKIYLLRRSFVALYLMLALVMTSPVYYLIARIDLAGGSTGWHRARLIESAIEHLDEWWLAGTDYTRHWMPTGVSWSAEHTDITNHYIQLGVVGGLPLMIIFILILRLAFRYVGTTLKNQNPELGEGHFVAWALGSSLFAHATTSISVSYFDQSFAFLYLTIACIASLAFRPASSTAESIKSMTSTSRRKRNGASTPMFSPSASISRVEPEAPDN
jgi:hypothetical protein